MKRPSLVPAALAATLTLGACTPIGLAMTAANMLGGGGAPEAAAASSPRTNIAQSLQALQTGATSVCQARLETPVQQETQEAGCRVEPVCLGGSTQPVAMLVCPDPAVAGAASQGQLPDETLWAWQSGPLPQTKTISD